MSYRKVFDEDKPEYFEVVEWIGDPYKLLCQRCDLLLLSSSSVNRANVQENNAYDDVKNRAQKQLSVGIDSTHSVVLLAISLRNDDTRTGAKSPTNRTRKEVLAQRSECIACQRYSSVLTAQNQNIYD